MAMGHTGPMQRLTPETRAQILARPANESDRATAARLGVPRTTVRRVLASTRAKLRTADEFANNGGMATAPRRQGEVYSWVLETIRAARDAQLAGNFRAAVKLANMMRTDDALFIAYHNRIAPQSAVGISLEPAPGVRGEAIQRKALASVTVSRATLAGICGTLANHGIAIGHVVRTPAADGSIIDVALEEWPLEHVRYNTATEVLETYVRDGAPVPITHGDGEWVVFRKFTVEPWKQEACILPGALLWAAHAGAVRDMAGASFTHGQAKLIGELPEGESLQNATGLTPNAQAFLRMLQELVSGEAGAAVRPFGSKTEWQSNQSTNWQIFTELIQDRTKAAARIYLGTDAILGSVGGAPGVDIAQLFGVATTKIQGDFDAIEEGLRVGVYEPWTAMNFGDSRLAPRFKYLMPDVDEARRESDRAKADADLMVAIEKRKGLGFVVDQDEIDRLAKDYGVPAPRLAPAANQTSSVVLAPTDVAKVVRVREARAASGLLPFGDERDDMTITELDARNSAAANGSATPSPKASSVRATIAAAGAFDEAKHPRADDGKFGSGGGGGGSGNDSGEGGVSARLANAMSRHAEAKKRYEHAAAEHDALTKKHEAVISRIDTSAKTVAENNRKAAAETRAAGIQLKARADEYKQQARAAKAEGDNSRAEDLLYLHDEAKDAARGAEPAAKRLEKSAARTEAAGAKAVEAARAGNSERAASYVDRFDRSGLDEVPGILADRDAFAHANSSDEWQATRNDTVAKHSDRLESAYPDDSELDRQLDGLGDNKKEIDRSAGKVDRLRRAAEAHAKDVARLSRSSG